MFDQIKTFVTQHPFLTLAAVGAGLVATGTVKLGSRSLIRTNGKKRRKSRRNRR